MTTTRRSDRNRRPPRRPPDRTAARTDDPAKSSDMTASDMTASELTASETASDEATTTGTAEIETPLGMEQTEAEQPGAVAAAEDVPAAAAGPEQTAAAPVEEHVAEAIDETETDDAEIGETSPDSSIGEPVAEASVTGALATGAEPNPAQDPEIQDPAPAAAEAPVAEPVADEAPAATADAPGAAPEHPGAKGRDEVPLAAMQGFIEINGRLIAFLQGESQAALAFWKAALTVRTPGELAQLQTAEMTRAVDAALICWQDLARRMERLPAFKAPRARAA